MLVRMSVSISGTVNGRRWPGRGGAVEVDAETGEHLIAGGLATEVADGAVAPPVDGDIPAPAKPAKGKRKH